ncbi:hypothetical protein [Thalassotalea sp. G2M2-11]|uniref:hypothetical protein n=1 Tax=Thalassotalea sp. G2M2-11 TaxID=2787627 RepID=UPI0019D2CC6C|nr:hypothetical protein [Thalassotalea sp. G2M2-11]
MIFSVVVIGIFVAVSIYFYFRAESLYRQLMIVKKEAAEAKKESKHLTDAFAMMAKKHEEFAQSRYKKIKSLAKDEKHLQLLQPLLNNYSLIFRESIRGKGQLHKITQKCCENFDKGHYNQLTTYINRQQGEIKRAWSANNLKGFISLVEAMLVEFESDILPKADKTS